MTATIALTILLQVMPLLPPPGPPAELPPDIRWCMQAKVTGYVRTEFSGRTWDGTSIHTDEPIAAASWNIPIDSRVEVEGVGTFRVADRGLLGSTGWVDIAVWTRDEAYALTSTRRVCVNPPD